MSLPGFVSTVAWWLKGALGADFVAGGAYTAGVLGWAYLELTTLILSSGQKVPLSNRVKRIMSEFFPELDLSKVTLRKGATFATPKSFRALTVGYRTK